MKQHTGIKLHVTTVHKRSITGKQMLENVIVLARSNNKTNISILKALPIKQWNPFINKQVIDFSRTLKIFDWSTYVAYPSQTEKGSRFGKFNQGFQRLLNKKTRKNKNFY